MCKVIALMCYAAASNVFSVTFFSKIVLSKNYGTIENLFGPRKLPCVCGSVSTHVHEILSKWQLDEST